MVCQSFEEYIISPLNLATTTTTTTSLIESAEYESKTDSTGLYGTSDVTCPVRMCMYVFCCIWMLSEWVFQPAIPRGGHFEME